MCVDDCHTLQQDFRTKAVNSYLQRHLITFYYPAMHAFWMPELDRAQFTINQGENFQGDKTMRIWWDIPVTSASARASQAQTQIQVCTYYWISKE